MQPVATATGRPLDAVDVKVGMYQSCARTAEREIWCWGSNSDGQFGSETQGATSAAATRVDALSPAEGLAVGLTHVCALTNGEVRCLGRGPSEPTAMPGVTDAVAIDASYSALCAVLRSGAVRCWDYDPSSTPTDR